MSQLVLINAIRLGTNQRYPGELIDDTIDPVSAMEGAGAKFATNKHPDIAAAAALARAKRLAGAPIHELIELMRGTWPIYKGANLADDSVTILAEDGELRVIPGATLGGARTKTLGTTGARKGFRISIQRLDVTANTCAIVNGGAGAGTLYTMPASKIGFAVAEFDGANWFLVSGSVGT